MHDPYAPNKESAQAVALDFISLIRVGIQLLTLTAKMNRYTGVQA